MDRTQQIVDGLVATGNWGDRDARLGVRANFHCEYCGRDLLASVDDYKAWQKDHIIPEAAGGTDGEENMAIACSICNFRAKHKWDPRSVCGENASRDALIQAVRNYVANQRTGMLEDVIRFRKIVYAG
ncbi:MAG: hypothetical protein A3H27_07165 [Acidobacteria bacterium RIFCSPLOWO2_02_FULL_59_13]|nr:MAG: hypothetical protein A3H27_07165 [Acidobacteria bacterium RIFCSPLOWO2_02_FULL_59_13]